MIIVIPVGLIGTLVALLIARFVFGIGADKIGAEEAHFEKFGNKTVLTATLRAELKPEQLAVFFSALSSFFQQGFSPSVSSALIQQINGSPKNTALSKKFAVQDADGKGNLLLCWTLEGDFINILVEGPKTAIKAFKNLPESFQKSARKNF